MYVTYWTFFALRIFCIYQKTMTFSQPTLYIHFTFKLSLIKYPSYICKGIFYLYICYVHSFNSGTQHFMKRFQKFKMTNASENVLKKHAYLKLDYAHTQIQDFIFS